MGLNINGNTAFQRRQFRRVDAAVHESIRNEQALYVCN